LVSPRELTLLLTTIAATLQYSTAGPFLIIGGTVIVLHLVSANLLIPKFIGSRVNIGPVAATVGMLFLELDLGGGWPFVGRPTDGVCEVGCWLQSIVDSHLKFVGGNAAPHTALGTPERRYCKPSDSLPARPLPRQSKIVESFDFPSS
jgi:hypothetical protein